MLERVCVATNQGLLTKADFVKDRSKDTLAAVLAVKVKTSSKVVKYWQYR